MPTSTPPASAVPSTPPASSSGTPDGGADQIVGTVVRFTAGSTSVEVTIDQDNPAVHDFLSMLPLTLTLEEFAGREKIAYLPRELAHTGSPGSDPEDGDLIYYISWGNIGFYYNTAGIGYSDQTIHLGIYDASLDQLEQLEGQDVIVEVVR
ncbi:MAG TPA: cyclophilin-like fold protein [Anaerolineales bacterium]|nr:cyclophilin-like fold protein [Anaerolineales bacterium]